MNVEVTSFISGCPDDCGHRALQTEVGEVSRANGNLALFRVFIDCAHSDVCKLKRDGYEAAVAKCQPRCFRSKSGEVS